MTELTADRLREAAERERLIRILLRFIPTEYRWMLDEISGTARKIAESEK